MPADKKVGVGWQIVFTFIPIVNFWAFYRIRKLRRYVLYVIVPEIILTSFLLVYTFNSVGGNLYLDDLMNNSAFAAESEYVGLQIDPREAFNRPDPTFWPIYLLSQVAGWGLQGFSIYLVILWSREHNRQFDQPTVQPTG